MTPLPPYPPRRVSSCFRKTAANFHYEFNIRHMAGVFQGVLMAKPEQVPPPPPEPEPEPKP